MIIANNNSSNPQIKFDSQTAFYSNGFQAMRAEHKM